MTDRMLTTKQRDVLHRRLARAVLWERATEDERIRARRMATACLDELDHAGFTAGTQRRAVQNIVASLDDATPLRSVSRADRDATPAVDAAGLGSGVAS